MSEDWEHPPPLSLFRAPVEIRVDPDKDDISRNIKNQAKRLQRHCSSGTDCDREGEHIGNEVRSEAAQGKFKTSSKESEV